MDLRQHQQRRLQKRICNVKLFLPSLVHTRVTYKNSTQEAYEKAVHPLFSSLDRAEAHLSKQASPFYFGEYITEADIRLYTTIVRFDPVYVQHFKCNIRDIRSGYPELHKWLRNLYWSVPAFGETTQFEHIKKHYTKSHKQINPYVSLTMSL